MKRWSFLLTGVVSYAVFLGVFLYAVGFVGDFLVPTSLNRGAPSMDSVSGYAAVLVNLLLLGAFAVQHSVMSRIWFKRSWTRLIPAPIERSVYVLSTCAVLILLFGQWRPIDGVIWHVQNPSARFVLHMMFAGGWLVVLITTFLINHFDLFGLRQVWLYFRGHVYEPPRFVAPGPYRMVRHPMYIGWLMAFWVTPHMTTGHLLFSSVITIYILAAIRLEERDLTAQLGAAYSQYRQHVPMLIPRLNRRSDVISTNSGCVLNSQPGG